MSQEWRRDGYAISTEASRLDLETVHDFLKNSYWAPGVPFEVVRRSVENSMAFGVYHGAEQVGFARVVTDRATFAYIAKCSSWRRTADTVWGYGRWRPSSPTLNCRDSGDGCWPPETLMNCTGDSASTASRAQGSLWRKRTPPTASAGSRLSSLLPAPQALPGPVGEPATVH